ncbi:hypothetical protein CsSME_00019712 [Camellia sinensis var. sinensis]
MECEREVSEVSVPVSPSGQYLNSSVLSLSILAVLESEIPIDDSQTMSLLKNVFLPINPRFSSIMVCILSLSLSLSIYIYIYICMCMFIYLSLSLYTIILRFIMQHA